MSFSDLIYRPFETLVRPLDIPYTPLPSRGPFALLVHFASMFRGVLAAVAILMIAIEGINLATIWGISFVVDGVTSRGAAGFLEENWPTLAVLGVLIFPVLPLLIFLGNTLNSQTVAVCMPAAMQWQGHRAVERQDLAFFHDLFAGQVATRISQVASAVQQQIVVAFYQVPLFLVQFVGSLVLLSALSWPLALPVFVWIAANIALAVAAVPQFSERSRRTARARSLVVGAMTDLHSNIQMVKLFAAEDSEAGAMRKIMENAIESQQRERRIHLTTDTSVILINTVLTLAISTIGFWGLVGGFVTIGQFVASIAIVLRLNANSRAFLQMGQQIFQAVGTIRDAMPVVTTPPTIIDMPNARSLRVTAGEVEFRNIHFEYRHGQGVIEGLSLTVRAGEKVGLVGLSGAGKSTLVSLLLRFFELKGGAISIDGQDIRSVTQASLRERIGVVTQDVSLLHRSVGDNIRYGRPTSSREEVEGAARLAEADGFIANLKDSEGRTGYDAFIGDRGVKLSGGQRQRVAIARVLLKDAPILVLDEATSALDSEAEAAVQDKLALLMEGKTVIAIAHRLSTIASMDRIGVLDKGRIVEEGTPSALLERDGLYARLWKRQTGGYIADAVEAT
ncbi:ATP-binding cassette domain-containing protein [Sinorhizobium medicae]|uniref:ABC transporter ATP-binding protein n=1 Tax=Sinorhizobium medicae TaxID=110321 RepID=UPI000FD49DFE|nr:ABC transporter ATP-binding protein [Sinorhizobium medicae]MDX0415011.1 ATP-binding cassette domain-containing protein [Sinorhizobium medicae]MDX0476124.1 ATP-binding cassette domain-containing protein [Sinorhizobium medicae]MDX0537699.1 ATP-binding cassette domain-containing protein [Sinorhizobium medicae]MDX0605727.1 ATP-binding cassette domain-containing protein [Sinorhizobium medicae]MDX0667246.1 ATP-binding cassette domain-containing protein [Sinorhizobium medicae]